MAQLTTNSPFALGTRPMPIAQGAELVRAKVQHALAANPGAGDVAWLCDVPADHVLVDAILDSDRLDTNGAPTVTISLGILNAGKTALASTIISASTIAQNASAAIARPTTNVLSRLGPATSAAPQSVGISFPAAAATFQAGTVYATLIFTPANQGA